MAKTMFMCRGRCPTQVQKRKHARTLTHTHTHIHTHSHTHTLIHTYRQTDTLTMITHKHAYRSQMAQRLSSKKLWLRVMLMRSACTCLALCCQTSELCACVCVYKVLCQKIMLLHAAPFTCVRVYIYTCMCVCGCSFEHLLWYSHNEKECDRAHAVYDRKKIHISQILSIYRPQ